MIVRTVLKNIMNVYCHIVYRIKVEGIENIPMEGAAIICPNHVHVLDSISFVPYIKRMVYIMAKEELFRTKFKNWIFRAVGCFPVKRGKGDMEAMGVAEDYLDKGELLMIFPEGTRNLLARGGKIKRGASRLALEKNVPIIPVGIDGDYKPFSKVRITVGKPITLEGYAIGDKMQAEDINRLTEKLQEDIVLLKGSATIRFVN